MRIDIALCCDGNFDKHLLPLIYGIIDNNLDHDYHFHIVDFGISDDVKQDLSQVIRYRDSIQFIATKLADYANLPVFNDGITLATYGRLKLAEYLPNLDKVLYLDVDTVVVGDLAELWSIDLKDYWIGASRDDVTNPIKSHHQMIGVSEQHDYFNAGVLLINLKQWRTVDLITESRRYFVRNNILPIYKDQDFLNWFMQCKTLYFDYRFNYLLPYFQFRKLIVEHQLQDRFRETYDTKDVVIYHYIGFKKQWDLDNQSNKYHEYLEKAKERLNKKSMIKENTSIMFDGKVYL